MSTELTELFDKNRDWARKTEEREAGFFTRLLQQQKPEYLWIGCADSRVPANDNDTICACIDLNINELM